MSICLSSIFLTPLAHTGPRKAEWAARAHRQARQSGGLHPQDRNDSGGAAPQAGLPPAATGLEGSDAHTAWPGPADAIASSDVHW
jgi:hypothetical protein